MLKIVADDKIPFLRGALEPYAEITYLPGGKITRNDLLHADALITRTRTKCNAELLDGTAVKFIATATIGYDHIDTAYCRAHGIAWANAPGCNSGSVMQYITSLFLRYSLKTGRSLKEMTLGIVGVGNVGSKVAKAAKLLGMEVLLNDPPRERQEGTGKYSPLDAILEKSDIITFHVPLIRTGSDATFHLADKSFFERTSQKPFLINSSRGEVVDNAALKEALKAGKLRGAALDVWENEPEIDLELLSLLDYATPHIAGYSADGKANGTSMSVNALASFFALPLYEFEPDIPRPEDFLIMIPPEGIPEARLAEAVFRSYDILSDDRRLRMSPAAFEQLRGDYPLRREFAAYRISGADDLAAIYSGLGFQIVKEQ
ncbi:MAG: 4-phosphoerythronate dehydrogenase PdxB [Victivallales bacterium]